MADRPPRWLGEGALSEVWLLPDGSACKRTRKDLLVMLKEVDSALRELDCLRHASANGPPLFAMQLLRATQDEAHVCLHVKAVLRADGRSMTLRQLIDLRPQLSVEPVCSMAACLASAMKHLHVRGIAHRDLKPENVCLGADDRPVLVDFGAARRLDPGERSTSLRGTLAYMAPEMLMRSGHGYAVVSALAAPATPCPDLV